MPHITVKMFPGRSPELKAKIADALVKAMMETADCTADSLSVAIEDVPKADWKETVYKPEIAGKPDLIFKKPGY